ncbi:hypothetical protein GI374_04050 [Paracoccus sp. S-4012]|uniref:hypothetical protein n=1 Tax=Paracoccus sp. S-4012 TaxID=2665648 RepID=UPI0012AF6EB7|nr:hypothetical protein [Paracoccus sp. S-4012]MRX49631.1 hypothetical protein [Paracoccus sp. S-4012]
MSAPAASGLPQPPQYAATPQGGSGDVLASIRRMIAEDEQGGAPPASPLPLRLEGPVLRLDSPVGGQALPPLRLGRGDSPEATRLRATAMREAIRARVPGPGSVPPEPAPIVAEAVAEVAERVAEAPGPAIEAAAPQAPQPVAAVPEVAAPVAPATVATAAQPPAEAASPEPAHPAAGFFGDMIREVLRQELRGESLDRMSGDLRSMVLREVARAITGGTADCAGW